MAAQQANFRMEPGSDAMKQRMQAMMRYNRLRQETRASNAVLQVKRKHQRREAVAVSYTHLRAHETRSNLVCRLLLEKKK